MRWCGVLLQVLAAANTSVQSLKAVPPMTASPRPSCIKNFVCLALFTLAQDSVGTVISLMEGRTQPSRAFPRLGTLVKVLAVRRALVADMSLLRSDNKLESL